MVTKIEWVTNPDGTRGETWNPIRGCTPVSSGCKNCYAARMASRFSGPGKPYEGLAKGGKWTGKIRLMPEMLEQPLRWQKPRCVFVDSMSDLFHENVPDEFIAAVFGVMASTPQHTYQLLTKRPKRMREWFSWIETRWGGTKNIDPSVFCIGKSIDWSPELPVDPWKPRGAVPSWPLPNLWLGVSVENQETADERIPLLLETPAVVRFVSMEPLLARTVLDCDWLLRRCSGCRCHEPCPNGCEMSLDESPILDQIIVGGESGPGARPMHPNWARSIRNQCQSVGVHFFFKQHGEWGPSAVNTSTGEKCFRSFANKIQWVNKAATWINKGDCVVDAAGKHLLRGSDFDSATYPATIFRRVGKKAAGRVLDGQEWSEMP